MTTAGSGAELEADRRQRGLGDLPRVGGHDCERLGVVADHLSSEQRMVSDSDAVQARRVLGRDHGADPGHGSGGGNVELHDAGRATSARSTAA